LKILRHEVGNLKVAEAVGGRYFNISLSSEHHINPFDLPTPREDETAEDVLRSNIINLVGLLRLMLGGLTPEEDSMVDRAISETYAMKDITPESLRIIHNNNLRGIASVTDELFQLIN